MRVSPVVPFLFQNYFFGTTEVRLWPYVFATFIGVILGTALYGYLGSLGSNASEGNSLKWIFFGFGILATILMIWIVNKKTKMIIKENG